MRRRFIAAAVAAGAMLAAALTGPVAASPTAGDGPGTLIIGGEDAPHARAAVSVHVGGRFVCSGVAVEIAGVAAVMTAAHCVSDPPAGAARTVTGWAGPAVAGSARPAPAAAVEGVAVRAGTDRTAGPLVEAAEVVIRPGWSWGAGPGRVDDAALIRPASPLRGVSPLRLADARRGQVVRAQGWGITSIDATQPPTVLQAATMRVVRAERCAGMMPGMTAGEVCVAAPAAHACYGDSGGPILGVSGGRWAVVGLASRARELCDGATIYSAVDPTVRAWAASTVRAWRQ